MIVGTKTNSLVLFMIFTVPHDMLKIEDPIFHLWDALFFLILIKKNPVISGLLEKSVIVSCVVLECVIVFCVMLSCVLLLYVIVPCVVLSCTVLSCVIV